MQLSLVFTDETSTFHSKCWIKEEIDYLSNLEELVKERDLYLEREKVLNMNEWKENKND